jgi:polynucleotide 5'-hydroxyl-kinase GRC3/NOL9
LQQTVQTNKTLLVDGPASLQIVSGKAEAFGKPLRENQRIIVREGKRKPFYATEPLVLSILSGAGAKVSEVEGSTIPESWKKPVQIVKGLQKKPVTIMVLGTSDAGKSSFCTYILNKLLESKGNCNVAILDGDLGQSDIGPSATVSYTITNKQVTELGNLRFQNGYFVGVTSPVNAISKTVQALTAMMSEVSQKQPDYIVINTDGFVSGDEALRYKLTLIKELKPDVVVGIQVKGELDEIMSYLGGGGVMTVQPSPQLSVRTPERRKLIRERTYNRYLRRSKLQCIPVSQLTVEPRNGVPKTQEPDKGILVGLYGYGTKFLGIGVLREINISRNTLKIQTAVPTKPVRLVFGKVVLDRKLQEIQAQV